MNVRYFIAYHNDEQVNKDVYPQLEPFVKQYYTKVTSKVSAGQPITVYKLR